MTTAEKYVTAAYCVVFALVLVYVVIIALKLQRLEREVASSLRAGRERRRSGSRRRWLSSSSGPALLALRRGRGRLRSATRAAAARRPRSRPGASGSAGSRRRRSSSCRRARGRLPVGDVGRLAQPLRLARRRRVPDLGLHARATGCSASRSCRSPPRCSSLARAGGGTGDRHARATTRASSSSLHVGLVLAAFAGLHARGGAVRALPLAGAAAEAARRRRSCAGRLPSLATLDRLAARTVARARSPLLTLGIAVGVAQLVERGDRSTRSIVARSSPGRVWAPYSCSAATGLVAAAARPTSRSPASRSSSSSGSPSP